VMNILYKAIDEEVVELAIAHYSMADTVVYSYDLFSWYPLIISFELTFATYLAFQ
jgi:hypothetical protein